jgi:arabinofuranan 3-O-arabinosyltransferase
MSVVGGSYGSELTPFEALEDCFRYDDATFDEAGLQAKVIDDSGESAIGVERPVGRGDTIELRAKDHMACIASTMPDYGGAGLYHLEYGYRSVALRKPRVAVYHRGPNVAEPLPANGSQTEWTTYHADLRPTLASVETRMYLYAPRDLTGQAQSVVQYRDVAITPVASSSTVTLLRDQPVVASPRLADWVRTTPGSFRASVVGDGAVSVTETNAPGWAMSNLPDGVTATKVRLNGWQSGWVLSGNDAGAVDLKMKYTPIFIARTAIKISLLSMALLPLWLLVAPYVRRRHDRRRQRRWERRARRGRTRFALRKATS